jgi:hypothetical protein
VSFGFEIADFFDCKFAESGHQPEGGNDAGCYRGVEGVAFVKVI